MLPQTADAGAQYRPPSTTSTTLAILGFIVLVLFFPIAALVVASMTYEPRPRGTEKQAHQNEDSKFFLAVGAVPLLCNGAVLAWWDQLPQWGVWVLCIPYLLGMVAVAVIVDALCPILRGGNLDN